MAWYEEQEVFKEKAVKIAIETFNKEERMSEWIVKKCLHDEYKQYNSFGSYRGFYTFILPSVLKVARRKNEIAKRKLALQTLRRAIPLKVWMNSILYRPPTLKQQTTTTTTQKSSQKSLRYEKVKANFEEQKNKNIKTNNKS